MRLGWFFATASIALSPRLQTTTSKPSLFRISSSPSEIWASSSTISILGFMAWFAGQAHDENAAAAFARLAANFSVVSANDLAGQGEPEAGTLNATAMKPKILIVEDDA